MVGRVASVDEWLDRLKDSYKTSVRTRRQALEQRKQQVDEPAEKFINSMKELAYGAGLNDDEQLVSIIEKCIRPKYLPAYKVACPAAENTRQMVGPLQNAMSDEFGSFRQLLSTAKLNAVTSSDQTDTGSVPVLYTAHRSKGQASGSSGQHQRYTPYRKHRDQKDLSHITCFSCGEKGHYASDCPSRVMQSSQPPANMSAVSPASGPSVIPPATLQHLWNSFTAFMQQLQQQPGTPIVTFPDSTSQTSTHTSARKQ